MDHHSLAELRCLALQQHCRDSSAMRYVYPVVSRRAQGVSIGINLNPNNRCNWRCLYCQVPNLQRGAAPQLDLALLAEELCCMLAGLDDFMRQYVPEPLRHLHDIALSGNGESTSSKQFVEVIELVAAVLAQFNHLAEVKFILITNGSQLAKPRVQRGIERMATMRGEVWFKIDRAPQDNYLFVNQIPMSSARLKHLLAMATCRCPTWIQSCMFAIDGKPPTEPQIAAYLQLLAECARLRYPPQGVLLYGIARPSMQPEAPRLSPVSAVWMQALLERIEALGLAVKLSL